MILLMTLSLASAIRSFKVAIISAYLAFCSASASFDGEPFGAGVWVSPGLLCAPGRLGERSGVWLEARPLRKIKPAKIRGEKRIFWWANGSYQRTLLRADVPWTRFRHEV